MTMKALARYAAAGAMVAMSLTVGANAGAPVFTPYHADGRYVGGDKVGWNVELAPGDKPEPGEYSFRITANEKAVVKTGSFDLKSGRASIEAPNGVTGKLLVVVDYMAPPPPPPPSPAQLKAINEAIRGLVLKTDPSLQDVLAKYPDYQFVHPHFDFRMFEEDRVATLTATVSKTTP